MNVRDVLLLGYGVVLLIALTYGFWRAFLRPGWGERITEALKELATLDDQEKLDRLHALVLSLKPESRKRVLQLMNEDAELEQHRP